MKFIDRFNMALHMGLSKEIFDHLRNFFMCAMLLALGTMEIRYHASSTFFGLIPGQYSGTGVVALAFILLALNFWDGIRKLSRHRYHVLFNLGLILTYIFISVRIVEMAWNYRIS
jgi:hypothetical protein